MVILVEDDDPHAQAAEPLIMATDVVQVVAPSDLPENCALDVTTTTVGPDGGDTTVQGSVIVVRTRNCNVPYSIDAIYGVLLCTLFNPLCAVGEHATEAYL